jgi:LuxR family maltose regulon positive regulatory protein
MRNCLPRKGPEGLVVTNLLSLPAHAVDRPRLLRQMDEVLEHQLALIVAPAGSGKSVLLAQWARAHPELQFVWLDVAAADDDPVRFSNRLLGGLAAINADVGDLGSLVSINGGGLGDALLEELAAQLTELPEVVIVLDDLHNLSNSTLITDLGRMVEHLPPNVHLVLSSRVDLPIAWSRRRLRHDMKEFRQSDLALDEADSAQLLERIIGQPLKPDCVTVLVDRTEGWAAGLQLAAMTLRHNDDSDGFVAQFSGTDRLVADYLSEEVLQALPEDRRRLLLRISVLDEMCADLVGCLTGEPNAQLVLEELERESMFLVPLDTRREWFRFHHLFRDLLRFRLRAEDPGLESILLRNAATWHLEQNRVGPAVECLLAARDWNPALELILEHGAEVFERGEMSTVIRWINQIPRAARAHRRDLTLLLGMLMGLEGQEAGAENLLQQVNSDTGASDGERVCAVALLSGQAQWRNDTTRSTRLANQALEMLDELGDHELPSLMNLTDRSSLRTIATVSGGRAYFLSGDFTTARTWLLQGLATPGAAYPVWRVSGLGSLALLEAWCGNIEAAEVLSGEALAVARSVGILSHPSAADAYLAATLAALEHGEPHRAALSLHEGSLRATSNLRSPLRWIAHLETALRQAAEGQLDEATTTSLSSRVDLGAPPPPIVAERLQALRCRLHRLRGSYDEAARALLGTQPQWPTLHFEHVAVALSMGETDLARKIMETAPAGVHSDDPLPTVKWRILEAWLAAAEAREEDADIHLAHAMETGEQYSLREVFAQSGPEVIRLVARSTERPEFRDAVLARSRETRSRWPQGTLIDPLTDRELEILSYLPSRSTNAEMAERCYVSVNTIKTHMTHIYRKLNAVSRNDAIRRARAAGLL